VSYFILRNGQQYGPYSPADLDRYLTLGGIVTTDLARTEEMNQWLPLLQIVGFTPPPPTTAETLASGCGGPSDQRPASAGPGPSERSLNVPPLPPPDQAQVYPALPESRVHSFCKRIHHFLSRFQFGLNGSHRSG
jgi:uncharacterized protein DUF4339